MHACVLKVFFPGSCNTSSLIGDCTIPLSATVPPRHVVECPGAGRPFQAWFSVAQRCSDCLPFSVASTEESVVTFSTFSLNLATREMKNGDEPMALTSGEFAVLKALVTHAREPLSRDKVMNLARGRDYSALARSIEVQESRLRRIVSPWISS